MLSELVAAVAVCAVAGRALAMDVTVLPPLDAGAPALEYVVEMVRDAADEAGVDPRVTIALPESVDSELAAFVPEGDEAFALVPDDGGVTIVASDARGAQYGALWLADRLRVEGAVALGRSDARAPVFRRRMLLDGATYRVPPGGPPEALMELNVRYSCNTHTHMGHASGAAGRVYLDEIDPRLVEDVEQHRRAVERNRELGREHLELITSWDILPLGNCGPFADMAGMVDQMISLYGADVTEDGVSLNQAAEKPWEVWQAMQRQYLQAFPEIVGIRSSMGDFNERYQIWRGHGPESSSLGATGGMRRFVEKAREVVVGELGRELVVSAWGNPPEEYPLNQPRGVREIFRGIDGSDSVSLLLNECEHDFYLNSPLNDNFGVGDVRKGVMFQVQREYQGMGEIPVYVGPRIAQRFTQCARYGDTEIAAARLWWSRNLYTSPVCWTWWNLYAWQRACWEPDGDPWEWARDWNRMTFGPAGAEELADALMMTEELAARTFYVPGYNGAKRDAYAITHRNTFTDGRHYWRVTPDPQGEAFRDNHVAGRVPLHMAQIEETRRLSGRVLEAARVATERMSDDEQARVVMESFEHFHALVPILTHYQQALLLKHYLDEPWHSVERRAELRAECVEHSRAALAAFDTYRARHDLYQDSGMVPLLRSYLREFGEPVPPPIEAVETFDIVWREDPPRDGEWPEPCHVLNAERISDSSMDINEAPHEPDPADVAYEAAPRVVASPAGLHVRIDVIGAWPPMPIRAGRIYRCGTIALNLDTNHDERGDATYYLIRDEDSGEPRLMTVMRDMRQRSLNYDELDGEVDAGCAVSLDTTDAGYRWECTIPWTMLGGFDPSAGVPLGVCWETHDAPPRPGVPWVRLRHPVVPAWRNTPPLVFAYGSIQR